MLVLYFIYIYAIFLYSNTIDIQYYRYYFLLHNRYLYFLIPILFIKYDDENIIITDYLTIRKISNKKFQ